MHMSADTLLSWPSNQRLSPASATTMLPRPPPSARLPLRLLLGATMLVAELVMLEAVDISAAISAEVRVPMSAFAPLWSVGLNAGSLLCATVTCALYCARVCGRVGGSEEDVYEWAWGRVVRRMRAGWEASMRGKLRCMLAPLNETAGVQ